MIATKIKMKSGCGKSDNLLEIDSVYVTGCTNPGYYKKEVLHDHLKKILEPYKWIYGHILMLFLQRVSTTRSM